MSTRKEKEREFRDQYIIDITEELFLEKGVANTTMDDIAKHCELSKTTIYKCFQSKDELEILIYQKIHSNKMKYLISEMEKKQNAYDKLLTFANSYYTFYEKNPTHLQFQLKHDYIGVNKKNIRIEILENMKVFFDNDIDYMNSVFKQGVKEGIFKSNIDSLQMLDLFYITLRATLNQTLLFNPETSFENMFSQTKNKYNLFVSIFLDGIKAK